MLQYIYGFNWFIDRHWIWLLLLGELTWKSGRAEILKIRASLGYYLLIRKKKKEEGGGLLDIFCIWIWLWQIVYPIFSGGFPLASVCVCMCVCACLMALFKKKNVGMFFTGRAVNHSQGQFIALHSECFFIACSVRQWRGQSDSKDVLERKKRHREGGREEFYRFNFFTVGLPGSVPLQQLFDRGLHSDALVHPRLICMKRTACHSCLPNTLHWSRQ